MKWPAGGPTKEEVDDELRLLPWFRYERYWPDPEQCELIWLLAHATLALWDACLVGNPAPVVQEMYERMRHPQIGDVVLEHGTRWFKDWPERALGRLVDVEKDPLGGHYYFVASLYFEDHLITRWENASFIALPVDETAYLGKRGPVVFTRDSLIGSLTGAGFKLKEELLTKVGRDESESSTHTEETTTSAD